MAIKEFRKILSQKWIIYILLLLCFVNVFLDTRNIDSEIKKADKKQEQQIEKIQGYNKYIENISSNANVISGFSLFADNNNYQVKSSKKIVNAYFGVYCRRGRKAITARQRAASLGCCVKIESIIA